MTGTAAAGTTKARCRLVATCDLGDPISCVYLNEHGCMAGTMLGKVLMHDFTMEEMDTIAEFSDEVVRGLYMDEDGGFATLMETCKGWRRSHPHVQTCTTNFRSLDKKNAQSVRHVLQRGMWACVLFPLSTTLVNVTRREHRHSQFKLFEYGSAGSTADVAPCDFDGERIVVVDRPTSGISLFRIVHLERNECVEVDDLPRANSVSLAKLLGSSCLVCASGSTAFIYDYQSRRTVRTLRGHRSEIIATTVADADATDVAASTAAADAGGDTAEAAAQGLLALMSEDGSVSVWQGATGTCIRTLQMDSASFYLGYPYCLAMHGTKILASADDGVFLLEYGDDSEGP